MIEQAYSLQKNLAQCPGEVFFCANLSHSTQRPGSRIDPDAGENLSVLIDLGNVRAVPQELTLRRRSKTDHGQQ